jgi:hypothetical protein
MHDTRYKEGWMGLRGDLNMVAKRQIHKGAVNRTPVLYSVIGDLSEVTRFMFSFIKLKYYIYIYIKWSGYSPVVSSDNFKSHRLPYVSCTNLLVTAFRRTSIDFVEDGHKLCQFMCFHINTSLVSLPRQ